MRYAFLLFFLTAAFTSAQVASFGVKAGVPFTPQRPYNDHWTVGVSAEFHLISGLSAEVDALYRSYGSALHSTPLFIHSYRLDAKAWDFPFLLKYRLREGPVRPFVEAGYSFTHESFDQTILTARMKTSRNESGPTAGAGVEFKCRRIKVSPEARYTHLFHSGLSGSNVNQLAVLVGAAF